MSDEQSAPEPAPERPSLEEKFKDEFMSLARALEAERYFHRQTTEELEALKAQVEKDRAPLVRLVNAASRVNRFAFLDRYGSLQCREASALQGLRDALDELTPAYASKDED